VSWIGSYASDRTFSNMLLVSTCVYRIHLAASLRLLRPTTSTMSSPTRRGPTQLPSYAAHRLHVPLATVILWRLHPWPATRMAPKMATAITLKMPFLMFDLTQLQTAWPPGINSNMTSMSRDTSTTNSTVFNQEAQRIMYTMSLRQHWMELKSDGIVDCLSIGVALLLLLEDLVMHSDIHSVYRLEHIEPRIDFP